MRDARLPRTVVFLFLAAVALVVAQLGWWTFFHVRFSLQQSRWQATQWADEREAAARLVLSGAAAGPGPAAQAELVQRYFPRLAWAPAARAAAGEDVGPAQRQLAAAYPGYALQVAPRAVAALRARDRAHVRMFVFEGAFFLGLLGLGVLALLRVLRHEVGLMRQQANFLSAVTHELKSPLAVIRLFCETLQMRAPGPDRQASYLKTMLQEVERLDGLVANLLAVARLDAGRITVHRELVELDEAVAGCMGEMRREALPAGPLRADMVYRPPPAPLWVRCDLEALRCIVRNLLDNAIKYGQAEGQPIEVAVASHGGAATVRVADRGRGLEPAELQRVFAKFYRVGDEMVRQREGSGLGLYLARALAEAQGGEVRATSQGPGRGATFTLTLPLAAARGGAA